MEKGRAILCPKMAEEEGEKPDSPSNSCSSSSGETYKHIDRLVLLHFFVMFVSSFALGLLFLHSSLTFWRMQYEEGYYDNLFDNGYQQNFVKEDIVNVVSYHINSSFSLVR